MGEAKGGRARGGICAKFAGVRHGSKFWLRARSDEETVWLC